MVEPEFDPGSYNGDCDMPDNYDDGHGGEDGFLEPRDADDSDDEDTWKPLNPHEPGTLIVKPYRKVNFDRRQGVNFRKRASLASEFPLARLHGTILCCSDSSKISMGACRILKKYTIFEGSDTGAATFLESPNNLGTISSDLNDMWVRKYFAMKKPGDSESPLFEKLRESLIRGENEDYNFLFGPKENNEENEYDSGDNGYGQPDFDIPESANMNEDVTQHAEKHEDYNSPIDKGAHEDPYAHANLEDLCRSHLVRT